MAQGVAAGKRRFSYRFRFSCIVFIHFPGVVRTRFRDGQVAPEDQRSKETKLPKSGRCASQGWSHARRKGKTSDSTKTRIQKGDVEGKRKMERQKDKGAERERDRERWIDRYKDKHTAKEKTQRHQDKTHRHTQRYKTQRDRETDTHGEKHTQRNQENNRASCKAMLDEEVIPAWMYVP